MARYTPGTTERTLQSQRWAVSHHVVLVVFRDRKAKGKVKEKAQQWMSCYQRFLQTLPDSCPRPAGKEQRTGHT